MRLGTGALDLVGGSGQVGLGAGLCMTVVGCAVGAPLIMLGGNNLYSGWTEETGWVNDAFRHYTNDSLGQKLHSATNIATSVYSLSRSVVVEGSWKLFRKIQSDFQPAYKSMTTLEILGEGAGMAKDSVEMQSR